VEHAGLGVSTARQGVADLDLLGAHASGGVDLSAIAAGGVAGQHAGGTTAEPDVPSLHRGLSLRHLGDERDTLAAEVWTHAQPLVHDGPGGAVVAPRLHEHRAARPAAVDVRAL